MRGPFQRDRDRVLHSTAFRRLTHKTQVFVYHEGDHYRTRLTHSLEVAQIARSMARILCLDEDLAEVLALAHDLGHPPFGHAGERALDDVMRPWGGFDHNAQSLRVVTELERKYAAFDGLNLTWSTLEGLVKHNGPIVNTPRDARARPAASGHDRVIHDPTGAIRAYSATHDLRLAEFASAEAQLAALADDIAYNNHDIDDGLRAGLIGIEDLRGVGLPGRCLAEVERSHHGLEPARVIYEINRRMITVMVNDVVGETRARLSALRPHLVDDIRMAPAAVVAFSDAMGLNLAQIKAFLFASVYRHPRVMNIMRGAQDIVRDLMVRYREQPADLPVSIRAIAAQAGTEPRVRLICDFVAGMTDRYAIEEHRRLFDATPELR